MTGLADAAGLPTTGILAQNIWVNFITCEESLDEYLNLADVISFDTWEIDLNTAEKFREIHN